VVVKGGGGEWKYMATGACMHKHTGTDLKVYLVSLDALELFTCCQQHTYLDKWTVLLLSLSSLMHLHPCSAASTIPSRLPVAEQNKSPDTAPQASCW
jgi:hypothetical protein